MACALFSASLAISQTNYDRFLSLPWVTKLIVEPARFLSVLLYKKTILNSLDDKYSKTYKTISQIEFYLKWLLLEEIFFYMDWKAAVHFGLTPAFTWQERLMSTVWAMIVQLPYDSLATKRFSTKETKIPHVKGNILHFSQTVIFTTGSIFSNITSSLMNNAKMSAIFQTDFTYNEELILKTIPYVLFSLPAYYMMYSKKEDREALFQTLQQAKAKLFSCARLVI